MSLRGYQRLTRVLSPLLPLYLRWRAGRGKEDAGRLNERFGRSEMTRPEGQLIWLHGASVGETTMLLPLIEHLLAARQDRQILVTSGTQTSARLMSTRLPERAFHQFVPLDTPKAVERFLAHWQPDLAVWAESELWPNLITAMHKAGIPMALINARMSEKSLTGWAKRAAMAQAVLGSFDLILPADQRTTKGLSAILGQDLQMFGNLKYDAPPLTYDAAEASALRAQFGERPVWLAASTHPPEEALIARTHATIRQTHPEALLIWMPRHPERGTDIASAHDLVRRSSGARPDAQTSIYLMDTLGEMGLALASCDLAVVCGAFDPTLMGHNPLEPARADVPILTGPYHSSFTDIYDTLITHKAAEICTADDLGRTVSAMLSDPIRRKGLVLNAQQIAGQSTGILTRTHAALEGLL